MQTMEKQIAAIRGFNRYYTNLLGLLDRQFLQSDLSLSEVRVLLEIALAPGCTSRDLTDLLCMDAGYMSRILKKLEKLGFLQRTPSPEDGRAQCLSLTPEGAAQQQEFGRRSDAQVAEFLRPLAAVRRIELVRSMAAVEDTLTQGKGLRLEDIALRTELRPGDIGRVSELHGWLYREEYGYGNAFEADVTASLADFLRRYDPTRSRLWCAEHHGRLAGCIAITDEGGGRAQLRWFVIDPLYRGLGLGRKLLAEALTFAQETGHTSVYLETTSDLTLAAGMYRKAGFVQIGSHPQPAWREDLHKLAFERKL